jgi:DNA-binding transcriptional ArsR family regulator
MSRIAEVAIVDVFFALGDPTRLAVVRELGSAARSATSLADGARVTRQAIAKHLRVLEAAGLVTATRHGREVRYALEAKRLAEARAFLDGISAGWDRALDRLRRLVEADADRDGPPRRAERGRPRRRPR